MSYLRASANYVWCTTNVLGKGATGAVFQGFSKHDGEHVAVKTFNQLSHMRPQEVQVREFEVLKKVKHENIVKLLAIEEETDGRGKVIVMELCTGGSLFNILDDPENMYGLVEDEFLLVLEHLSAGMKHLRDNNLVHRDLKPGNIMKYVAEDGRTIYKLTDFGAARELEDDQEFISLYGTEEYLHPDLYERAVLRKPVGKTFGASVDLWSIGVTLFHVATGNLPFRPYGGRKNKEMMYHLTTKKESGVISGCQTSENGPVEWKRDMPTSCQLSIGLKFLLTPLLAGLMEVDPRKQLSFDAFFSAVQSILCRRRVHIFFVNKIQSLRVYMDYEENALSNLQLLVMAQTDIAPEKQVLIYKDNTIETILGTNSATSAIPRTSDDTPMILFHRENNNVSLEWDTKDLAKFAVFPNLVNVENDASLGKHICGVGYSYRKRVEKICRSASLINEAVRTISQVIVSEWRAVSEGTQLHLVTKSVGQQIGLLIQFHKTCRSFLNALPNSRDKLAQDKLEAMGQIAELHQANFRSLNGNLLSLDQHVKQLNSRYVENGVLMNQWKEATADIKDISRASIKAATHATKLRESWQQLLRDRATRNLTYNDEQFHILERIKMQKKSECLAVLLNEECQSTILLLTERLSDWYKIAQAAFIKTEILAKDTKQFEETLQLFTLRLTDAVDTYSLDMVSLSTGITPFVNNCSRLPIPVPVNNRPGRDILRNGVDSCDQSPSGSIDTGYPANGRRSSGSHKSRKEYVKTFNRGLKELTNVQEEVWTILKENAELVNQFQTLTLSLLSPSDGGIQSYDSNSSSTRNSLSKNDSSDLSGKSSGSM